MINLKTAKALGLTIPQSVLGKADQVIAWARPTTSRQQPPCKQLLAAVAASGGVPVEAHWYPGVYHGFNRPNLPERVLTNVKLPPG